MNVRRHGVLRAAPWRIAGCVTALALLVSGCTSTASDGPTGQSVSGSPVAPPPSVVDASPMQSGLTGSIGQPFITTVLTANEPWPRSFTAEQQANALSAISAFTGYAEVVNSAQQDPVAPDWAAAIRKFTADPTAQLLIDSAKSLAQGRVHQIGTAIYSDTRATAAIDNKVTLVACVDQSSVEFRDEYGKPVTLPSQSQRNTSTASVYYYGPEIGWLVSEVSQIGESQPC